ncbi:bifunctional adenosylcobinamide kinase/adenosylcobinamide-phosphate guanylyltransferase [Neobacillus drentensis]|uniref:bifunctional adenosylcobinamide kinase/adenosylcobinamide-phosphate guanylyltransferase n=1 Tax=Neobacillus drentensis TaxID=220684 RepID=UPI003000C5A7
MGASSLIFITGGVRSGKSSFAERKAVEIASITGGQLNYLATGVPSDPEMKERIEKHQHDREAGSNRWKTVEQSVQIEELANDFSAEDIILLDCVTTLLNNELFSSEQKWDECFLETVKENIITGITSIKKRTGTMIVVSNEVLNEPLLGNEMVFTYGRLLGQIHQYLVKEADQVFLVEAGIPIVMKGVTR